MSESNSSGGISVAGLLGVVFVTLKLTHVIDWSWWWVTAPFWGGLAIFAALFLIGGVLIGLGKGLESLSDRRAKKADRARRDRMRGIKR